MATVLRVAGSRPDLVISTTVLAADQADLGEMNDVFADSFPTDPPARTLPRGLLFSVGCTGGGGELPQSPRIEAECS